MDLRLSLVLLSLLLICLAKGDVLHFNTEFTSNCSNIDQVSCCDLLDSKLWLENKSPVDGDGIIINGAEVDICFGLSQPLNLSSVQTNLTKATIVVRNTLSIINLVGQDVWMNIANGMITFGSDLDFSMQGNITISNMHIKSLSLQFESTMKAQNLTIDKDFTSDSSTAMYCDYMYSGDNRFSQDGLVECNTIVMANSLVWINGYMKANTINSTTYFHIEEGGKVDVGTLNLRALSVHGTLTSVNDIYITFGPYVRGIITAPKLHLEPTALLYGNGIVNGSVVSHGRLGPTFTIQDPPVSSTQLTITGDLWAANNEFHVAIRSTTEYFLQSKLVVYGIAIITNMTIGADFATGYEIQPFNCVVMEFGSAVGEPHLEANFRARLDISQNQTALTLSGYDWYIKPPVEEPLGSLIPDGSDNLFYWKIAAIALACLAVVLLVIIVVMLIRRNMAKQAYNYDLIVE